MFRPENLDILKKHPLLLNLEVIGTFKVKELFPYALLIYILPENLDQIKDRLEKRTFSDAQRAQRLKTAEWSIQQADRYDYQIVNKEGSVDQTVTKIADIISKKCDI